MLTGAAPPGYRLLDLEGFSSRMGPFLGLFVTLTLMTVTSFLFLGTVLLVNFLNYFAMSPADNDGSLGSCLQIMMDVWDPDTCPVRLKLKMRFSLVGVNER